MSLHGRPAPLGPLAAPREVVADAEADAFLSRPDVLKTFGITRVGDVTGLDVIGVPVWFAARPNSRGLSVSQGKGLTDARARISAIMEAIEGAVAEDTQRHIRMFGSIRSMVDRRVPLVPFDRLPRVAPDLLDPERERAWIAGHSMRSEQEIFAPYELVGLDLRAEFPWDRQAFVMGSQGLGAGFDLEQAIHHALLELVEHNATLWIDGPGINTVRPVAPHRLADDDLHGLDRRLAVAGIPFRLFDLTAGNGVPVVMACLPRQVMSEDGPGERWAAGVAARQDAADAARTALLEAIQSRLTDISGARDDLTTDRYRPNPAEAPWQRDTQNGFSLPESPGFSAGTASDPQWKRLAAHLFRHGVDDVFTFPLGSGIEAIKVVRVLASGLAGGSGSHIRVGDHALEDLTRGLRGR